MSKIDSDRQERNMQLSNDVLMRHIKNEIQKEKDKKRLEYILEGRKEGLKIKYETLIKTKPINYENKNRNQTQMDR